MAVCCGSLCFGGFIHLVTEVSPFIYFKLLLLFGHMNILVRPVKVHMGSMLFPLISSKVSANKHPHSCSCAKVDMVPAGNPGADPGLEGFFSSALVNDAELLPKLLQLIFPSAILHMGEKMKTFAKLMDGFLFFPFVIIIIHFEAIWLDRYQFRIVISFQGTLSFTITHWSSLSLMLFFFSSGLKVNFV